MLNKQIPRVGTVLLAAVAVALLVLAPGAPAAHRAASATTIRIWTDQDRKAAGPGVRQDQKSAPQHVQTKMSDIAPDVLRERIGIVRDRRHKNRPESPVVKQRIAKLGCPAVPVIRNRLQARRRLKQEIRFHLAGIGDDLCSLFIDLGWSGHASTGVPDYRLKWA